MSRYIDNDDNEFPNISKLLHPFLRLMFQPLVDPSDQKESLISNPFSFLFPQKKNVKKDYVSFAG
ncbi:4796_t:CDS:1, partial [Acaulospora colombiana]